MQRNPASGNMDTSHATIMDAVAVVGTKRKGQCSVPPGPSANLKSTQFSRDSESDCTMGLGALFRRARIMQRRSRPVHEALEHRPLGRPESRPGLKL